MNKEGGPRGLETRSVPAVSVVIPTYNRKAFLGGAVRSVMEQTYSDFEIIVVDDGSSDGTAEWIAQHYPAIRLLRLPGNQGAAAARNRGIEAARGSLVAFLDSDDRWLPEFLQEQVRALKRTPGAVLSFCNCVIEDAQGRRLHATRRNVLPGEDLIRRQLMLTLIDTMSAVVARRSALMRAGPLEETLRICHDRDLYIRLLGIGSFIVAPRPLLRKVRHEGNIEADYRRWLREALSLLDAFYARRQSAPYRRLRAAAEVQWHFNVADVAWREHRDYLFAARTALRAFLRRPRVCARKAASSCAERIRLGLLKHGFRP